MKQLNEMNYLENELRSLLKKDNKIFDFLQESALDGLWYWDLTQPDNEWMNPAFWEVLGYDPATKEHTPASWMDIIHPDDLREAQENVTRHLQNPDLPYDQIIRYTHAQGHKIWIRCRGMAVRDEKGRPIRMLGAHTDVTEVKRKEELLERCNSISGIGYWEMNYLTGNVEWSKTTRTIHEVPGNFKPTAEQFLGTFANKEQRAYADDTVSKVIREKKEQRAEFIIHTAAGNEKWVDILIIPQFTGEQCSRLYGTILDIDKKKRAQTEIDRLLTKTNGQNDRLVNFTNIVSHNLRSQVGGVISLLELIELDKPELNDHELFKYLKIAAQKLSQTMYDLSDVAIGMDFMDSDFKAISLKTFIENKLVSIIEHKDKDRVNIINHIDEDLMADVIPAYLESILHNLITNAVKYRAPDRVCKIELNGGLTPTDSVWFSVSDNGQGIDLDKFGDQLFGMYKTFHDNIDSKGVGLFITRNQVDIMDGSIRVESTPGKGTTFTVEIPIRHGIQSAEVN